MREGNWGKAVEIVESEGKWEMVSLQCQIPLKSKLVVAPPKTPNYEKLQAFGILFCLSPSISCPEKSSAGACDVMGLIGAIALIHEFVIAKRSPFC